MKYIYKIIDSNENKILASFGISWTDTEVKARFKNMKLERLQAYNDKYSYNYRNNNILKIKLVKEAVK